MTAEKMSLKNEFAFFQIKSRLFGPSQYVKWNGVEFLRILSGAPNDNLRTNDLFGRFEI